MQRIVKLEPEHVAFCEHYVKRMMANRSEASKAVSWRDGKEDSLEVQLNGKCSEWGVAKSFGLDPRRALNWGLRGDETDIVAVGKKIDVKGTRNAYAKCLMYSLEITHLYERKDFDTLLFIRPLLSNSFFNYELIGWTTKEKFWREHYEAPDGPYGRKFDEGTWYMHMTELYRMEDLR